MFLYNCCFGIGFCDFCVCAHIYVMALQFVVFQGDTKGSAKGGDTSAKKDVQQGSNPQVENSHTRSLCDFIAGEHAHKGEKKN